MMILSECMDITLKSPENTGYKRQVRYFREKIKKRVMGIEPTYPAWKAGVLPLNYTRKRQLFCLLDTVYTIFP